MYCCMLIYHAHACKVCKEKKIELAAVFSKNVIYIFFLETSLRQNSLMRGMGDMCYSAYICSKSFGNFLHFIALFCREGHNSKKIKRHQITSLLKYGALTKMSKLWREFRQNNIGISLQTTIDVHFFSQQNLIHMHTRDIITQELPPCPLDKMNYYFFFHLPTHQN